MTGDAWTLDNIGNMLSPQRSVWQFVPVSHIKKGFYLRNLWDGAYLKALNMFRSSWPSGHLKRRYVIVWTSESLKTMITSLIRPDKMIERKKDLDDSLIWILEKSEIDDEKISISNSLCTKNLYMLHLIL